jgi:F420 biosynthesis protein FbiB-like protein
MTSSETQIALARAMNARLRHDLSADGLAHDLIEKDVQRSYSRITSASALLCLCLTMADMDRYPDPTRAQNEYLMAVQSTAMAGQNILLAAHHYGLGACWMCAPLFCPDVVKVALHLPDDWQPQALITLGYAAEERHKDRQPLESWTLWR